MKLFISSDIEGTCCIADWNETYPNRPEYTYFSEQMTREVSAVCRGALSCGFDDILVRDAHEDARNINPSLLPDAEGIKVMRNWTEDPLIMMSGIQNGFDACAFTGFHAGAYTDGSPLCHTMSLKFDYMKINGEVCTEFDVNTYTAAYYNVPVVFVSGDKSVCEKAKRLNPNIVTVPVVDGTFGATTSVHPNKAVRLIEEGIKKALSSDLDKCLIKLPKHFDIEIKYLSHIDAERASYYPGMVKKDLKTVTFSTDDYFEVLRMIMFLM